MIEKHLPRFFNYGEEKTNSGYESLQDFYLSWLLRCSAEKYSESNVKLYEYSKRATWFLCAGEKDSNGRLMYEGEMPGNFLVEKVSTIRQYKRVDLIAKIDTVINQEKKSFVLNIENKWYTNIRSTQLPYSTAAVLKRHENESVSIQNLVIFCDDENISRNPSINKQCLENDYSFLSILDIRRFAKMENFDLTQNDLFDEYWFRRYVS